MSTHVLCHCIHSTEEKASLSDLSVQTEWITVLLFGWLLGLAVFPRSHCWHWWIRSSVQLFITGCKACWLWFNMHRSVENDVSKFISKCQDIKKKSNHFMEWIISVPVLFFGIKITKTLSPNIQLIYLKQPFYIHASFWEKCFIMQLQMKSTANITWNTNGSI